jgi:hypothetical protein
MFFLIAGRPGFLPGKKSLSLVNLVGCNYARINVGNGIPTYVRFIVLMVEPGFLPGEQFKVFYVYRNIHIYGGNGIPTYWVCW